MIEKIKAYVKKYHMLTDGDTVVAGVSGGADSVCLLFVLKELQKEIDFTLFVVHVNHKIRREAGEDACFVEELCRQLDLPFFLVEENVEDLAKAQGISTEEAGREVRYRAFEEALKENAPEAVLTGHGKIAVAHNSNDRAETMLFNLFRGTGIAGLCGIRPKRDNVIRPILCLSREEIETFLEERNLSYCIDKTNNEDTYTRNKIRHHILPFARQQVSEGVLENMTRTGDLMQETEDFINTEVEKAYGKCVQKKDAEVCVNVEGLLCNHSLIRKHLILRSIEDLVSTKKDISAIHVRDVLGLFEQTGNRQISLPYGILVRREYENVVFEKRDSLPCGEPTISAGLDLPLDRNCIVSVPGLGELEISAFSYEKNMDIPQNQYTKWFDYDKIDKPLKIRNRKPGDFLTINKALSKKSIQDYMVDEKIPKAQRDKLWLVTEQEHVLWVVGYRISEKYKVNENTKTVLQIQLRGGHGDGRTY